MKKRADSVKAMQWFQVLRQGGLVLVAIAMANGLLSKDQIGNYELLVFAGFSLSFFWVDGLLKSYLMEYELSQRKGQLNFHVYLILLVLSAMVLGIFSIGGNALLPRVLGQAELAYFQLYGLYLFLFLPTSLLSIHFLLRKQILLIYLTGLAMLVGPLLVVLVSMGVYHDIAMMYGGFVLYAAVLHVALLTVLVPKWNIRFEYPVFKTLLVLAWPLMIYAIAMSMARVFDGWLVSWYFRDEGTFAIFRYGAREFPLAVALSTAITTAFVPHLQQSLETGLNDLKKRSSRLMDLLFPVGIALMLVSPFLFRIVFTDTFAESAFIFNVYLLLIISQTLFPHAILLSMKENKLILRASLIELSVNILLSFIMIAFWELEGVALATAIAYLVEKAFYAFYLRKKHGIDPGLYIPLKRHAVYSVCLICSFLIARFLIW